MDGAVDGALDWESGALGLSACSPLGCSGRAQELGGDYREVLSAVDEPGEVLLCLWESFTVFKNR